MRQQLLHEDTWQWNATEVGLVQFEPADAVAREQPAADASGQAPGQEGQRIEPAGGWPRRLVRVHVEHDRPGQHGVAHDLDPRAGDARGQVVHEVRPHVGIHFPFEHGRRERLEARNRAEAHDGLELALKAVGVGLHRWHRRRPRGRGRLCLQTQGEWLARRHHRASDDQRPPGTECPTSPSESCHVAFTRLSSLTCLTFAFYLRRVSLTQGSSPSAT